MDASQLTQKNRNQMIFAWYWDKNLLGEKVSNASSYDIQINRVEGAGASFATATATAASDVLTFAASPEPETEPFLLILFFTLE